MTQTTVNPERIEQFAGEVLGHINGASLALLISVGHKLGIFDWLAENGRATSEEVAKGTNLNERYVREWLNGLTVGRILEYSPQTGGYTLPAEHAAVLTRAAGTDNLGPFAQFIPLLASVYDQIVDCFRNGGGVGYEHFHSFHELMAEESAQVHDNALIDGILPLVDGLPASLSSGVRVADIGCGRGHAVNLMAAAYPKSSFIGLDISSEAIAVGEQEAETKKLSNAEFRQTDLAKWDATAEFDLITAFDVIHDQAQPATVLDNVYRALKPGGVFLMVDVKASSHVNENVDHPLGPALYTVSAFHCMTVSLADEGVGLGTAWGEQLALGMLDDAGFSDVSVVDVEGDILNSYYIARK